MLKKLKTAPTVDIKWQGEVVASVRGLTPADVTAILVSVGEDLAGLFSLAEEVDGMKLEIENAEALANQLLTQWPKFITAVGTHMPNVLAQLIANAADAPEEWEMVRDHYSFVLQFEILAEIALSDKKRSGGTLDLIVPDAIGSCKVLPVPVSDVLAWIQEGM